MTHIYLRAEFIKQFKDFYAKDVSRWVLHETICISKRGDKCVEFAATDGQKLLVIRRPLDEEESMDDGQYIVQISNLPLKGKYLAYWLKIEGPEAVFNDAENVYRFPLKQANYPDYKKLIEQSRNCEKVKEYTMFRWENMKALHSIFGDQMFNIPKQNGHAFLWSEENLNGTAKYVLICSHLLNTED